MHFQLNPHRVPNPDVEGALGSLELHGLLRSPCQALAETDWPHARDHHRIEFAGRSYALALAGKLQRPPVLLANQDKRSEILALAKPVGNRADTGQRQAVVVRHLTQIIVAALRPASAIEQKQIGHFLTLPSAESRTACGMRPAFRRGWEGEGKPKSMPWRGPAGAQATATRGRLFRFGEREGKALGVPAEPTIAPVRRSPRRAADHQQRRPRTARRRRVTCRRAECATRLLREAQRRRRSERASGAHPARREARAPAGQHQDAAPSGARSAGQSASLNLPAHSSPLPIVTRMGRDYRPGPRQRIERVARRAAP